MIDRLYTHESFAAEFAARALPNVRLSPLDMQVLLKYLQRDRRVLVADKDVRLCSSRQVSYLRACPDGMIGPLSLTMQTIKILSTAERTAAGVPDITEAEKGILQVKSTSQALEEQIADLESRIAE